MKQLCSSLKPNRSQAQVTDRGSEATRYSRAVIPTATYSCFGRHVQPSLMAKAARNNGLHSCFEMRVIASLVVQKQTIVSCSYLDQKSLGATMKASRVPNHSAVSSGRIRLSSAFEIMLPEKPGDRSTMKPAHRRARPEQSESPRKAALQLKRKQDRSANLQIRASLVTLSVLSRWPHSGGPTVQAASASLS